MIEQRFDGDIVVTPDVTAEQLQAAQDNPANKSVELVPMQKLQKRLEELRDALKGTSRAALQAARGKKTGPRFDRTFARKQWRRTFAEGTFEFRGKLPSCPSFRSFNGRQQRETILATV